MKIHINTNISRGLYEYHTRFSRKNSKKNSPALGGLRSFFSGPLWPFFPSTALFSLYGLCFLSVALCSLCGPQTPLRPSIFTMAICTLYITMYPLWSSSPSTILCALYNPLSTLRSSVPSMARCPRHGPLSL
jgi:hypothetical protein